MSETLKKDKKKEKQPEKCTKCKNMYGNVDFDNMCSLCYKEKFQIKIQDQEKQQNKDFSATHKLLSQAMKQNKLNINTLGKDKNIPLSPTKNQVKSLLSDEDLKTPTRPISRNKMEQAFTPKYLKYKPENQQKLFQNEQQKYLDAIQIGRQLKRAIQTKIERADVGKCQQCNRKTNLLGYDCNNCSFHYCRLHRIPQNHSCMSDFVTIGKKKLRAENQSIQKPHKGKIAQI